MSADLQTWAWLAGGAALLVSELALPGLVAAFLGAAALTVAGLRWAGFLDGFTSSALAFAGLSTVYVVALRSSIVKWFGQGESSRASTDEDVRTYGKVVEVVEAIDGGAGGRIRLDGTTWPAHTLDGAAIPEGAQVRIVLRDNIGWVVEAVLTGGSDGAKGPALPARTRD